MGLSTYYLCVVCSREHGSKSIYEEVDLLAFSVITGRSAWQIECIDIRETRQPEGGSQYKVGHDQMRAEKRSSAATRPHPEPSCSSKSLPNAPRQKRVYLG